MRPFTLYPSVEKLFPYLFTRKALLRDSRSYLKNGY